MIAVLTDEGVHSYTAEDYIASVIMISDEDLNLLYTHCGEIANAISITANTQLRDRGQYHIYLSDIEFFEGFIICPDGILLLIAIDSKRLYILNSIDVEVRKPMRSIWDTHGYTDLHIKSMRMSRTIMKDMLIQEVMWRC